MDPCKAAFRLFQEMTDIVGSHTTRKAEVEALEDFVTYPVTREMVTYIAQKATDVIPCAPTDPNADPSSIPELDYFIACVVDRSHCQVPTLMTSLVFLDRLKERLPGVAQGLPCTRHRLFLAALILSAKYVNDSSPKNKHWAIYSHIDEYPGFGFSLTEVNLMEKQLLYLLDWDLIITESDLLIHFEPFLSQVRWDRVSARLEKELTRRELVIDEDTQLPAPQFVRPAPPKGTKPPTDRERDRAHAAGHLFPDEERHQFLLSKCQKKKPNSEVWSVPITIPKKAVTTSPILSIDQEDPYLVTIADSISRVSSTRDNEANKAIFSLEGSNASMDSLNEYSSYASSKGPNFPPTEMSRSSTQDSYLSTTSSRFNSVSRGATPASSMTSLSGDDLDYSCHDDEDNLSVFMNEEGNSANCSYNPSPEFQYQYSQHSILSKPKTPPTIYTQAPKQRSMTRSRTQSQSGNGVGGYRSFSPPQVRAYEKQGGGGYGSQRVSPTQGHTGVVKKGKGSGGESKSLARIRQTLEGLEGDSARSTKRSRFLPKFLGGGGN